MHLQDTIAFLTRTPAALNALLRDQADAWTRRNEGGESWTPVEIVGHLIAGERTDWMPRTKMILESGESRTFEPFDMSGHARAIAGKSLTQLLDDFAALRATNLDELRALNLQPKDFERRGRHPEFGPVTLGELLATWAGHDLTHLHQLTRVLAYQVRNDVGPWSAYLGVMHCSGHSAK